MSPYDKRLTPLIKRMAEDMLVRNFSPSTIDAYTYQVDKFQRHFEKPIQELGEEESSECAGQTRTVPHPSAGRAQVPLSKL